MSAAIDILKAKTSEYVKLVGANSDTKIKKLLFLYILAEAVLEAKASGTDFLGTFVSKYDPSMVTTEDGIGLGAEKWAIAADANPDRAGPEYAFADNVETVFDAATGNPTGGTYIAKVIDGVTEYTFKLPVQVSRYHTTPPAPAADAGASGDVDECPSESESEDECSVKHFKMYH